MAVRCDDAKSILNLKRHRKKLRGRITAKDVNPDLLKRALVNSPVSCVRRRRPKYGNEKTDDGFDSKKESRIVREIEMLVRAREKGFEDVVEIQRQRAFELIPSQKNERGVVVERPVKYVADLVLVRKSGALSVYDVKSEITRKNPAYVIKRKLMLYMHGISIIEC